jgi:hypothetical protein
MSYIYLYGMVLTSQHIKTKWNYPEADSYCEIEDKYYGIGGETGTAAVILNSLGCRIKLAGSHLGHCNNELIRNYFASSNTDLSELVYDEKFNGVEDMVIIDKKTRTCFGQFASLYAGEMDWVEKPSEKSVKECEIVGCDPFFGEEIAELSVKYNKKYAVIDCLHDSYFNKHCSVNVVSHEFLKEKYPKTDFEDIFKLYTDYTDGLVIFTQGEGKIMYGRKENGPKYFKAYNVNVISTLGAGDSFKAGTIYGLYHGFDDDRLVCIATATAAYSCSHYPIAENPATLEGIDTIIYNR